MATGDVLLLLGKLRAWQGVQAERRVPGWKGGAASNVITVYIVVVTRPFTPSVPRDWLILRKGGSVEGQYQGLHRSSSCELRAHGAGARGTLEVLGGSCCAAAALRRNFRR